MPAKPSRKPPTHLASRIDDGQPSPYLSLHQCAAQIHVSVKTLLRLINAGRFAPFTRIGRLYLFRREVLDRWLAAQESATGIAPHVRTRRVSGPRKRTARNGKRAKR